MIDLYSPTRGSCRITLHTITAYDMTNEYNEAVKAIVKVYNFSCSAQAIYWDRDHYNACYPPHPSEGVPFQHDYPNPPKMASTFQAPADDSLVAYARSQLQFPAPKKKVIPPERLMPWFHAHIDPQANNSHFMARTVREPRRGRLIPDNPGSPLNRNPMNDHSSRFVARTGREPRCGRLITDNPDSPLNHNPMNDLPANLNAVFPLPEPSLNRYQPLSLAVPKIRGGNPPHQRAEDQMNPISPRVENMLRQINTYHNFGYSWEEIAKKLADVGAADDVTAESVRKQWEGMQGNTDYHWTGPVVKKNDAVEPGEFTKGAIEAIMKGRIFYPKE